MESERTAKAWDPNEAVEDGLLVVQEAAGLPFAPDAIAALRSRYQKDFGKKDGAAWLSDSSRVLEAARLLGGIATVLQILDDTSKKQRPRSIAREIALDAAEVVSRVTNRRGSWCPPTNTTASLSDQDARELVDLCCRLADAAPPPRGR